MENRSTYKKSCASMPTTTTTTSHTLSNLNFVFFTSLSSDSLAFPLCSLNLGILLFLCALQYKMPALKFFYLTSYAFFSVFSFRASLSVVIMATAAASKMNISDMEVHPTPRLRKQILWLFSEIVYLCGVLA